MAVIDKVAIAGGGVGGLTVALALQRAGVEVEVHERYDHLQGRATGFTIWSYAIKHLLDLGVPAERLDRIGGAVEIFPAMDRRRSATLDWMPPQWGLLAAMAAMLLAGGCGQQDLPTGIAARVGGSDVTDRQVSAHVHRYAVDRAQALVALIQARWVAHEARRLGLPVPPRSATTDAQARRLTTRLAGRLTPAPAQVAAYYRAHRARFGPPRRRDAWFIRAGRVGAVSAARARLARGDSWEGSIDVARRRDPHARGAALPFVERRSRDKWFGAALFATRIGKIAGPLRGQRGWYILQPFREYGGPSEPPKTVRPLVEAQARKDLLYRRLEARYASRTDCAARYDHVARSACAEHD